MQQNADIPVLTDIVDPDELPEPATAEETFPPDAGPVVDLDRITCTLCDQIAEQIESELRMQLEARLNQALESAMPQIRREVRDILQAHLGNLTPDEE